MSRNAWACVVNHLAALCWMMSMLTDGQPPLHPDYRLLLLGIHFNLGCRAFLAVRAGR